MLKDGGGFDVMSSDCHIMMQTISKIDGLGGMPETVKEAAVKYKEKCFAKLSDVMVHKFLKKQGEFGGFEALANRLRTAQDAKSVLEVCRQVPGVPQERMTNHFDLALALLKNFRNLMQIGADTHTQCDFVLMAVGVTPLALALKNAPPALMEDELASVAAVASGKQELSDKLHARMVYCKSMEETRGKFTNFTKELPMEFNEVRASRCPP